MYDPIFAKSFSRYDRRRFGCFALIVSLIVALTICSTFKPSIHPLTLIGDAVSLQLSITAVENVLIDDAVTNKIVLTDTALSMLVVNETADIQPLNLQSMVVINETSPAELPQLNQSTNIDYAPKSHGMGVCKSQSRICTI